MRSRSGLLFICLMLFAACGGEASVTTSDGSVGLPTSTVTTAPAAVSTTAPAAVSTTTTPAQDTSWVSEAVVDATDSLVALLGVDEAAVAVVLALDHGYSLEQLMEAAATGTLNGDGTITGIDPDHESFGLISNGNSATTASATDVGWAVPAMLLAAAPAADDSTTITADGFVSALANKLDRIFSSPLEEQRKKVGRFVLHFLFHLASLGYSGEQIIDGILFGEITALQAPPPATLHCWGLTEFASDGSLRAITPALPPAENSRDQCKAVAREFEKGTNADLEAWTPDSKNWFKVGTTTKTVTVPEDDPLPWTFAGTGTVAVTVATVNELAYSNVWEFSITLFDDGTLEYTHRLPAGRAGYGHNCPGGDLYQDTFARAAEVTRQGTHADGTLSIPITYANDRKAVQEGTYTQEAIRLDDLSAPYDLGCEDLIISMVTEFPFDIPRTEP